VHGVDFVVIEANRELLIAASVAVLDVLVLTTDTEISELFQYALSLGRAPCVLLEARFVDREMLAGDLRTSP
jgi:hypothetical protein